MILMFLEKWGLFFRKYLYSDQVWESTDQKKLRIWILFTQYDSHPEFLSVRNTFEV